MRLIDADTLIHKKRKGTIGNISGDFVAGFDIDTSPTIDAVPVVRCRECKYHKPIDYCTKYKQTGWFDDDFCSRGHRKEVDHDKHPSDPV